MPARKKSITEVKQPYNLSIRRSVVWGFEQVIEREGLDKNILIEEFMKMFCHERNDELFAVQDNIYNRNCGVKKKG